jgi:hypothetical protein
VCGYSELGKQVLQAECGGNCIMIRKIMSLYVNAFFFFQIIDELFDTFHMREYKQTVFLSQGYFCMKKSLTAIYHEHGLKGVFLHISSIGTIRACINKYGWF